MQAFRASLTPVLLAVWAISLIASADVASNNAVVDPIKRHAYMTPKFKDGRLLGVANAGNRVIAVGERGVAIYSDDGGTSWNQAFVPVSVTLTVVRFLDEHRGFAAGHNGVLLRTNDAGAHWEKILDGNDVIKLYTDFANQTEQQLGSENKLSLRALKQARQLEADGPDKPWLDLTVDADGELWLAGAYGLLMRSKDGANWKPWSSHIENPRDLHLYSIASLNDEVVIGGEQGLLLRSTDRGETFNRVEGPYEGSYFFVCLADTKLVVAGLRGNTYISDDHGVSFKNVSLQLPISITAGLVTRSGTPILVDQTGGVYKVVGDRLETSRQLLGSDTSALVELANGTLVAAGQAGVSVIESSYSSSK